MNTSSLAGRSAVITGAGSGIGRAIALRLAERGVGLCLVGRTPAKLEALRSELASTRAILRILPGDLDKDDDVLALRPQIERFFDRLDILVHSAGVITLAPLTTVSMADVDAQYRVNVRAPLLLTQSLLPLIARACGQVVFINSSLGVHIKEHAGAYAASKHALKALADTLRAEINPTGVRVISVFPGNTATAMQEQVCRQAGKPYDPDAMLRPDDVAAAVVDALALPPTAEVTDLHIRPAQKPRA